MRVRTASNAARRPRRLASALNKLLPRSLHEHADPAQRVLGVAALPQDSAELVRLLTTDPAIEVRAAAAERCSDLAALAALQAEAEPAVYTTLVTPLGRIGADPEVQWRGALGGVPSARLTARAPLLHGA